MTHRGFEQKLASARLGNAPGSIQPARSGEKKGQETLVNISYTAAQ